MRKLENDLFRLETQGTHFLSSGIQGQPEVVIVRAVRPFVRVAVRRLAIAFLATEPHANDWHEFQLTPSMAERSKPVFEAFVALAILSLICFVGYTYGKQIGSRKGFAAGRFHARKK